MSAYDPKQTSKARQSGRQEDYFFTLDLLGGEPVWQVLHGLPFAILAVACALDIVSEFTASVRKYGANNRSHNSCVRCRLHIALQFVCSWCTPALLQQHELQRRSQLALGPTAPS